MPASRSALVGVLAVALAVGATACGRERRAPAKAPEPCAMSSLRLHEPGTLTIGTADTRLRSTATALAAEMGFGADEITWTRVDRDRLTSGGEKDFDFALDRLDSDDLSDDSREAVDIIELDSTAGSDSGEAETSGKDGGQGRPVVILERDGALSDCLRDTAERIGDQ